MRSVFISLIIGRSRKARIKRKESQMYSARLLIKLDVEEFFLGASVRYVIICYLLFK